MLFSENNYLITVSLILIFVLALVLWRISKLLKTATEKDNQVTENSRYDQSLAINALQGVDSTLDRSLQSQSQYWLEKNSQEDIARAVIKDKIEERKLRTTDFFTTKNNLQNTIPKVLDYTSAKRERLLPDVVSKSTDILDNKVNNILTINNSLNNNLYNKKKYNSRMTLIEIMYQSNIISKNTNDIVVIDQLAISKLKQFYRSQQIQKSRNAYNTNSNLKSNIKLTYNNAHSSVDKNTMNNTMNNKNTINSNSRINNTIFF
jgi:hypothetical protein